MAAGPFFVLQIGEGPITGAGRALQSAVGSGAGVFTTIFFSRPRPVQRHNPRISIRQVFSAWWDAGAFADGDRDRERSPAAITMAQ
jgi:hypothetical protein